MSNKQPPPLSVTPPLQANHIKLTIEKITLTLDLFLNKMPNEKIKQSELRLKLLVTIKLVLTPSLVHHIVLHRKHLLMSTANQEQILTLLVMSLLVVQRLILTYLKPQLSRLKQMMITRWLLVEIVLTQIVKQLWEWWLPTVVELVLILQLLMR